MKLKRGRPPKKKPFEKLNQPMPVETIKEILEETPEPIHKEKKDDVLCDCGKVAHPGSHQCWACSHRP